MKLFLASMSIQPETVPAFRGLFTKSPEELRIAFIPTAADPYPDKWFVDATRNDMTRRLGATLVDVDLKGQTPETLREALADKDAVFVNGGNTFYLLDWVRKSGFDVALREFLAQGKVYAGASAGAIIVGPSIELAGYGPTGDANDIGLADLTGLGLVDFAVWPHLTDDEREHVDQGAKTVSYPIIAINDRQAVVYDNGALTLAGPGDKMLLNGFAAKCPSC